MTDNGNDYVYGNDTCTWTFVFVYAFVDVWDYDS